MQANKSGLLFGIGGLGYMGLEMVWRGWTHGSMFLAGGTCFLLIGKLSKATKSPSLRALGGAGIITAVELGAGLLFNRNHSVWDYRQLPGHFQGQICLPYSLLWIPVGLGAALLYETLDRRIRL